ncbi:hypothetical protein SAMN05421837_102589 [Amycolatopsis pretoriensis]|uniref:ATP-grasp domain-containing protein n=1 Tax=Amycolatopsis pretoriensis TaxID=218821 RepID=A0A1H5QFI7_9PSEU|nr:peptide ligase PGM1-related protein [Amycolatopsis pretoriensis]SEF24151.1 hypothetical protein SAMN05421837_102589 [Amycolatopsis pretoriensis]
MTAGRIARLGTFDAERWWRPAGLAELPAAGRDHAAVDAMDELVAAFCAPGDLLVTRRPVAAAVRESLAGCGIEFDHCPLPGAPAVPLERLVPADPRALARVGACAGLDPYAVLDDTVRLAARCGWAGSLPAADVVAEVNSKSWSNELVRRLGLPGAGRVVRSADELAAAVAAVPGVAVVKDPFGVSGRAMLEVRTEGVLRAVLRTVRAQVARGRRVEFVVQPKFAKLRDLSGHVLIEPGGRWRPLGVRVMTNRGFRHLGSAPAEPALVTSLRARGYFDVLGTVAEALARAGYWGPVGVDSMLLRDGSLVPVLEINARRSLGLLALTLDRRTREHGLRCHLWEVTVTAAPGTRIAALAGALRREGLLYQGGARPGVALVSGSGLAAPGGRVHCALMCVPGDVTAMRRRLLGAVIAAGLRPHGAADAA